MNVNQLIEKLKKYPGKSLVEISVGGNIYPASCLAHWDKDRNGLETVMITHPPLDSQCKEIYDNMITCPNPLCKDGFIEGEIGNGPSEQLCPDCRDKRNYFDKKRMI